MPSVCEVQTVLLVGDHARLLQYAGHCNGTPQAVSETHKLARSEHDKPYKHAFHPVFITVEFSFFCFLLVRAKETHTVIPELSVLER